MAVNFVLIFIWGLFIWATDETPSPAMDATWRILNCVTNMALSVLPYIRCDRRPHRRYKRPKTSWLPPTKSRPRANRRRTTAPYLCLALVASATKQSEAIDQLSFYSTYQTHFDSDEALWRVDNGASRCISHHRADFLPGTLHPTHVGI